MILDTYIDGVLRERRDHGARVVTTWNAQGAQVGTRPYTAQEIANAELDAEWTTRRETEATIAEAQRAFIEATLALAPAPTTGSAWVQPVGAVDAYPLGAKVSHNGSNWENTGSSANVWMPGVFGWVVIP